ncbi:MAG: molybdenum cofactor guanylyltransferase [Solirubrobacteraceae bacterium]|nr:molybdenum cofactor guanylyltransferase [Solirubrobacteraceae bacterium]
MQQVVRDVIVVAKPDTALPPLPGVIVWREPADPQHPLMGLVAALRAARDRAVVACAADMPFVSTATLAGLVAADAGSAAAVVAVEAGKGALQPLLARYEPSALAALAAAVGAEAPLRITVEALGVARFEVADPIELFNVNTPEDLARAEEILVGRGGAVERRGEGETRGSYGAARGG